ncbi:MAG: DUF6586 family protein [Marinobacter sp.]|uniref:DUF6586 family protein n=1 Tax=Marinobacter sp. TaxID=50741 RepID=UPI00299D9483|nr:DUF6586 family protein [Marinobacter sp.]MDX1633460.1 DUF6586 family protein [Marinobacter sp.]
MASEWHTLASQKLFLAQTLLRQRPEQPGPAHEAHLQGCIELALRARQTLLALLANYYQHKHQRPSNLAELQALIGAEATDSRALAELENQAGSWWNHLEQLAVHQSRPPAKKKTVSDDNIIAVAVDTGPERSPEALERTLAGMKVFLADLAERHEEW